MKIRQKQCDKCPWKKDTDPHEIPAGYSVELHHKLACTIAERGELRRPSVFMACHESPLGREQTCTGWFHNQLGVGNNLGLRMLAMDGRFNEIEVFGEQHARFEDTLPDDVEDEIEDER